MLPQAPDRLNVVGEKSNSGLVGNRIQFFRPYDIHCTDRNVKCVYQKQTTIIRYYDPVKWDGLRKCKAKI